MTVLAVGGPPDRVLVTDGGDGQGRSALAAVRALGRAGYRVSVTTSASPAASLAARSRWCGSSIPVPPADADGYADAVGEATATGRIGWVVPASDLALVALRPESTPYVDKAAWAARAHGCGIATPPTVTAPSASALRDHDLPFPAVVKPVLGRAPAVVVADRAALDRVDVEGPVLAQPFIAEPLRAVALVVHGGAVIAAAHQRYLRTWPTPAGTSSAAVTTPPDEALEARLAALVDGFDGVVQFQLAGRYLLDVNPRVYGSLPLAVVAGVNLPAIAIDAARGRPPAEVVRARPGVAYRWIEGDLRHLASILASARREGHGATGVATGLVTVARALLPLPGAAHSVWAADDPLPQLVRLATAVRRGVGGRS